MQGDRADDHHNAWERKRIAQCFSHGWHAKGYPSVIHDVLYFAVPPYKY